MRSLPPFTSNALTRFPPARSRRSIARMASVAGIVGITTMLLFAQPGSAADRPRRTTTVAPTTIATTTVATTTVAPTTFAPTTVAPTTVPTGGTRLFTCATGGRVAIRMAGSFTSTATPFNMSMSYTTITTAGAASFATMTPDSTAGWVGYNGWAGTQLAGSAPTAKVDTKWVLTLGAIPTSGSFTAYLLVQQRDASGAWVNQVVAPAVPCTITP